MIINPVDETKVAQRIAKALCEQLMLDFPRARPITALAALGLLASQFIKHMPENKAILEEFITSLRRTCK